MPILAAEEETLEDVESNYDYTISDDDDSVIELDPVYLEGREVDIELLSAPAPRTDIDFVNLESDRYENSRGFEIIEFSIPVE
ncbi:hypothetical protein [cf. Phormidesmis sp. LEGE 11477]|uniref:hypothetical protein n=1 Tax=cf. Phormidesmis sp. LEGE 11477 TaxID=1828680 RepID=UPI001881A25F|nr:hypothetical protein [cf. Phormidesmis sp. LEGE 11477]MBE9060572.1 hypothetical protein [cf. Phormidesmis sp. LEGE 11477]